MVTRSYPLIINVSCWETLHLESLIFQQATAATEMPNGSRKITWRRQGLEDEFPLKLADSQKILEMTVNPLFSLVLTHLPCFPLWVKQCHKPSPSHPMIIQWFSNDYPIPEAKSKQGKPYQGSAAPALLSLGFCLLDPRNVGWEIDQWRKDGDVLVGKYGTICYLYIGK